VVENTLLWLFETNRNTETKKLTNRNTETKKLLWLSGLSVVVPFMFIRFDLQLCNSHHRRAQHVYVY